jgi:hypothetical protein
VLNRAEWLKFVATFFNVEDKANALYDQIAQVSRGGGWLELGSP